MRRSLTFMVVALILGVVRLHAEPLTDRERFTAQTSVVGFDEVPLADDRPVSDEFRSFGVVLEAGEWIFDDDNAGFPGMDASTVVSFDGRDCMGPASIFLETPVARAGFFVVTNNEDDVVVTVRRAGVDLETNTFATDRLEPADFVGVEFPTGIDELVVDAVGSANHCVAVNDLHFDTCGNGTVEAPEECDDGPGNGSVAGRCSADCEAGDVAGIPPSVPSDPPAPPVGLPEAPGGDDACSLPGLCVPGDGCELDPLVIVNEVVECVVGLLGVGDAPTLPE